MESDPFGRPRREEDADRAERPLWAGRPTPPGWLPPVPEGGIEPAGAATAPPQPPPPEAEWTHPAPAPRPVPGAPGQPVEWGTRVAAAVIDGLVRLVIVLVPTGLGAVLFAGGESAGMVGVIAGLVLGAIAAVAYAPVLMARWNGQTVGHRVVDTRIVRENGERMTLGQAALREIVVKALLFEGLGQLTLYVGTLLNYLWPLWDDRNQALHDKVMKTRVVRDEQR